MLETLGPELIELFKTRVPKYIDNLEKSFQDGDLQAVRDIAHNLSSVMGLIEDTKSSDMFRKLDKTEMSNEDMARLIEDASREVARSLSKL